MNRIDPSPVSGEGRGEGSCEKRPGVNNSLSYGHIMFRTQILEENIAGDTLNAVL